MNTLQEKAQNIEEKTKKYYFNQKERRKRVVTVTSPLVFQPLPEYLEDDQEEYCNRLQSYIPASERALSDYEHHELRMIKSCMPKEGQGIRETSLESLHKWCDENGLRHECLHGFLKKGSDYLTNDNKRKALMRLVKAYCSSFIIFSSSDAVFPIVKEEDIQKGFIII
jgi:hypothetical protein